MSGDANQELLNRAASLLKDEPCCSAGLALVEGGDGLWRVKPSGREYTLGVGRTPETAIENALAAVKLCPACFGTGRNKPAVHGPFEANGSIKFTIVESECETCSGLGIVHSSSQTPGDQP